MSLSTALSLGQTALELGLICSLTVLALFLSYSMLNVCDLSTDGCFTLGASVGAVVAIAGHPFLSLPAAMLAGMLSGFITAVLQTRMGIDSLLAGIIVNTGLYSVNIAVMGGSSLLNMNKVDTVFSAVKDALTDTPLEGKHILVVSLIAVALVVLFLTLFLNTRLGLAIRATGNNPDMVRSSSINPIFTTTVGLCVAHAFTGLSGCLLAFAMSFDDVVISIFVNGPKLSTLPIKVYTQLKTGVTPEINALCTVILTAVILVELVSSLFQKKSRGSR